MSVQSNPTIRSTGAADSIAHDATASHIDGNESNNDDPMDLEANLTRSHAALLDSDDDELRALEAGNACRSTNAINNDKDSDSIDIDRTGNEGEDE